jgi:hypothetical protein
VRKYSKKYKVGDKTFRYDYENSVLEYVGKVFPEMIEDNKEWREKYGHDMWTIRDGMSVIDEIGLSRDNWEESPEYWCEAYASELHTEVMFAAADLLLG